LVLLPERAIYWPSRRMLLVADVHLGKAASFRALGIPIPPGSTRSTLVRLDDAIRRTESERICFLGDLWHAKAGRTPEAIEQFGIWRASHAAIKMTLVEGNHDVRSGRLLAEWDIAEVAEPHPVGPFSFCHHPDIACYGAYRLAGHIHPAVLLEGRGRQALRLPCFYFGPEGGLLPSFGDFTGFATIKPCPEDRIFVVADDRVVKVA